MKKILRALILILLVLLSVTAQAECHHTYDMVDVKMVTCESDGYYLLKCNDCGHTVKEITDKAYGHDWAYVTGQEADCTEDGFKRYMCGNCGESRIETLTAPGHKWKDSHILEEASCTKAGSMRTICEVCGLSGTRVIEKGHKYGEWTITEEATDHSKGTRTRTCRICKKKQTESYYPEGTLYKNIKNKKTEVKELQQMLTDLGFLNDKVDGIFGAKTEKAVKALQKEHGLTVDGIAWPQTIHNLGVAWNAAFGEPEAPTESGAAYPPMCTLLVLEDETEIWDTCEVHADIFMHAADELPETAAETEIANAYTAAWQAELERLYQLWLEKCAPEDQPMVINHKTMFMGYLNSQQFLWNTQYGEGSMNTLNRVNMMLMYQCSMLCDLTYRLTPAE